MLHISPDSCLTNQGLFYQSATPIFEIIFQHCRYQSAMKKLLFVLLLLIAGVVIYFSLGSEVTNNLDTYIYDLPFKEGTSHKVVQGYGGLFSHKNKAALDFSMPEGTPVYAAREGVIYSFKDNSNEGGPFSYYGKKSNYIIIKHSDRSYGCYWHLKKDGVVIKKGEVAKGQLIGFSGSTGFVLRPHLHFTVKRQLNYKKDSFVKTKFRTTNGIQLLEKGETYQKPLE
jgi:murein DD-endopeptidase MepM/ murein hydrolase activator NlpD